MIDKRSATRSVCIALFVSAGLMALGCAHAAAPMRVRYGDIDKGAMKGLTAGQPLIIEFQPGDRIPVNFELTGDGFELEPQHPQLELVVKEHYFLRVGDGGLRMSPDPDHFDKPKHPGSFRVGFWLGPDQRAKVNVVVAAARR
jgi:hypothetical protein